MRLLLVDFEAGWRGGQSQALLLLKGLRQRGHIAELLSIPGSAFAARAAAENTPVHFANGSARRLSGARLLRRLLQEQRFDVVHANEAHALTAAWFAQAHRHAPLVAARRVVFPLSRGRLALLRYRAAAGIIAVSNAVRAELLAAELEPARVHVVADGVELPAPILQEDRQRARERWGLTADDRVFAFVASFTEEKGHALLLEAFAALQRGNPRSRLLLAGDGPLRAEMESRARSRGLLPAVIFAGFVEDVAAIYSACDAFVFPSLSEGGGTSLLSAMAYSLPVVAFASGGVVEIIADGENGLLVQEPTAEALSHAMKRLVAEPELVKRLSATARETIAARFSAARMVEQTIAVLQELRTGEPLPGSGG